MICFEENSHLLTVAKREEDVLIARFQKSLNLTEINEQCRRQFPVVIPSI